MPAMDVTTNDEEMGVQKRYSSEHGNHALQVKEIFQEADIKGNSNIFNCLKTETIANHNYYTSSLNEVKFSSKKKLEVDNSLFSYSSFKKAMDLRVHNRTVEGGKRTIFDDAENFAKNHRYKLLPITFEQVDETIIQSEHNYSLFSLSSESEAEEDCSRMMVYTQIKEKNYKRRRTKFRERSEEEAAECENSGLEGNHLPDSFSARDQTGTSANGSECLRACLGAQVESPGAVQPLDLSGGAPTEDEKTDSPQRDRVHRLSSGSEREVTPLDSDKENVNLELNGIRVTITRPDEKENYQPCDLFLNDIARLVPWLIDRDCFEVDILDRTCDGRDDLPRHRLYYVISESTWRLFQTSNERVILTNDRSLGQPSRKAEKGEKASYLVFDQLSLAKCLAEYCQEIGGCFEYTCIEEGKCEERLKQWNAHEGGKEGAALEKTEESAETKVTEQEKAISESVEEDSKQMERIHEAAENAEEELTKAAKEEDEKGTKEVGRRDVEEAPQYLVENAEVRGQSEEKTGAFVRGAEGAKTAAARRSAAKDSGGREKSKKEQGKGIKVQRKSTVQPEQKHSHTITRSKSTSESETSQKCDEGVSGKRGRKRGGEGALKAEPPRKKKSGAPPRRTRSGKVFEEAKTVKAPSGRKESAAGSSRTRRQEAGGKREGKGEANERNLRSSRRKGKEKKAEKEKARAAASSKSKNGKR